MAKGVVAGYPMVDVRVRLVDGKYHTVDSNDMAFQIAGSVAIRRGALDAGPVLLEPIAEATIHVPEKYLGDIMSDINGRRGKILGTELDDPRWTALPGVRLGHDTSVDPGRRLHRHDRTQPRLPRGFPHPRPAARQEQHRAHGDGDGGLRPLPAAEEGAPAPAPDTG